jgi:hypothetical protein
MNRKTSILALVLLALAGAAYYRYVPGRTPEGQPPLAYLDAASVEQQLRGASGQTRVLVMLSPT